MINGINNNNGTFYSAGCVSKNLTLYKNAHKTKPTIGTWSSLLIQLLSHDQNKVKNGNILK